MSINVMKIDAVLNKTGLSRSAMYKMIAERDFPEPIKLGARAAGWICEEVEEWIQTRISARNGGKLWFYQSHAQ